MKEIKTDDFADIPMANGGEFDRNETKTIKMDIFRAKSYQELAKDGLFAHHLKVMDSPDSNSGDIGDL